MLEGVSFSISAGVGSAIARALAGDVLVVTCSVRSMKLGPELGLEDCCKIKLSCWSDSWNAVPS